MQKSDYLKVQAMLEHLGATLFDMVVPLVQ